MRLLPTALIFALAFASATRSSAQEGADPKICAQLLPAIERLEAMLVQDSKARTAENETHDIEKLETLVRAWLEKKP